MTGQKQTKENSSRDMRMICRLIGMSVRGAKHKKREKSKTTVGNIGGRHGDGDTITGSVV